MLMIPKLIIFLLVLSEEFQDRNQYTNKMNDREFFTLEYISISNTVKNNFMTHQYQLYALSKLKYRNHKSFCRYLLLLSGDVEPNPGPENSCTVCEKKMALRHRVLCCKQCDSWVHKKCADISEIRYKSIKNKVAGFYFECGRCNYAAEMPFSRE